jgi:xylose isomerase
VTTDRYVPTSEDRFSFGIWTVGWQGVDVFGGATRPPMPADRAVRKLAELGAKTYVCWGGRDGAESGAAKDIRSALDRLAEAFDVLTGYVLDQRYDLRFAIEPKPNEPRGDILLPTAGHALAFINELAHPELVGINPEVGHEEMSGLNYAHAISQALWHGKLFHIDLNGQHGPRYDQDLRFGAGNARGAFWVVDALEAGGYDGPVHFDFKPPRTEDDDGVCASAAACMRNYLILRAKARAFRADQEVAEALRAARVDQLALPTLAEGENWQDIKEFTPDVDELGRQGMAFERLDQLALEYLYGVRT